MSKRGSDEATDRLIRRYHGFVRLKASSYFLVGGDSDDLIQEGLLGLYKAIRDFRTDRESSFRNFAELCITRQIITAVKAATRNKHSPLNQYVSFGQSPAANGESETTMEEILPGPSAFDPVNQAISAEELSSLVTHLRGALSEIESSVLGFYLEDRSYEEVAELLGYRHQGGRQRAPASQAQGRPAPRQPRIRGLTRASEPGRSIGQTAPACKHWVAGPSRADARLAQLAEHLSCKQEVSGSIPEAGFRSAGDGRICGGIDAGPLSRPRAGFPAISA